MLLGASADLQINPIWVLIDLGFFFLFVAVVVLVARWLYRRSRR